MRNSFVAASFVVVCLALALGCGGGDNPCSTNPTAPSCGGNTMSVPTSITVSLTTPLMVGGTAQATATATLSNGSTQSVTTGFKSDVPSVATVTDSGLVTAVSGGAANIYVVWSGAQGTKNIRVVPSYAGSWSGTYSVTGCSQSGAFADENMCAYFPSGSTPSFNMFLTQSTDSVSGTTYLGAAPISASSSTVGAAGDLTLNGTFTEETLTVSVAWYLTSPTPGKLAGTVQHTWRDSTLPGQMIVNGQIADCGKMMRAAPTAGGEFERIVRLWRSRIGARK